MPLRNKNVRFETWHNGYRRNMTPLEEGNQDTDYEYVEPTEYFVGIARGDGWTYETIKGFPTAEQRSAWIKSYKLFEEI